LLKRKLELKPLLKFINAAVSWIKLIYYANILKNGTVKNNMKEYERI